MNNWVEWILELYCYGSCLFEQYHLPAKIIKELYSTGKCIVYSNLDQHMLTETKEESIF